MQLSATDFAKMKLCVIWACFLVSVAMAAWTAEDHEIFSLNQKIRDDLGLDVTFYLWLGLDGPNVAANEISKAYRKKSRQLHPDKVTGLRKVKRAAEERFQRLSLVGNILRDQLLKKRYDYFLAKGFPQWKESGWLYLKFRPGFVLTLVIIWVLVSSLQLVALRISRAQDFKRVVELKDQIKRHAWGGSMLPPTDGSTRKVVNQETGREFVVTPDGAVGLLVDGAVELVDENTINTNPGFSESLFVKVPLFFYKHSIGRIWPAKKTEEVKPPTKKKKPQAKGEKVVLPSGKTIRKRK